MTALAVVLSVEAALVLAATALTIVQFAAHGAEFEADGFAYIACLVIGFLWVGLAATGVWLVKRWARGLAIVWQLIQLVVGIGAMQGLLAGPLVGAVLLVFGLAGLVLAFTPGVTRALRREPATRA
ncbi:hypothetical protein [Gryllotalpicola daejeonensis]|uniref:hypothetical protein n=1 Tax=Gryllotalpicola daejeonensis TaxID=993087 RepID=UPI0031DD8DDA